MTMDNEAATNPPVYVVKVTDSVEKNRVVSVTVTAVDVERDEANPRRSPAPATMVFGAQPDTSEKAVDLDRAPKLRRRVMQRLKSSRDGTPKQLRADQRDMACELVANGRSVDEVARAFDVDATEIRRLVD